MMTLTMVLELPTVTEMWDYISDCQRTRADLIAWLLSEGRIEHALELVPEWQVLEDLLRLITDASRKDRQRL